MPVAVRRCRGAAGQASAVGRQTHLGRKLVRKCHNLQKDFVCRIIKSLYTPPHTYTITLLTVLSLMLLNANGTAPQSASHIYWPALPKLIKMQISICQLLKQKTKSKSERGRNGEGKGREITERAQKAKGKQWQIAGRSQLKIFDFLPGRQK